MSKLPFFKFFSNSKFSVSDVNKYYVGVKPQPTKAISSASRTAQRHVRGDLVPAFTLAEVFSPYYNSPRKVAFTLAEVLITLGIIGVVAAMTLPALIANGRKTETISRLKKFNSTMQQAILMAQKDYGETENWNKSPNNILKDDDGNPILDDNGNLQYDVAAGNVDSYNFISQYILPYIKYVKVLESDPNYGDYTTIYLADGSVAQISNGACIDVQYDVNGLNRPNQQGIDKFYFLLCTTTTDKLDQFGRANQTWGTRLKYDRNSRESALNHCKDSSYKYACTRLLELDNWEFKDDYPYKL